MPIMARTDDDIRLNKTLAQWLCLVAGALLALAGLLGFAASGSFSTGPVRTGDLIVFGVNGWSNLLHLGTGLVLLAAANTRPTAKTVALVFGVIYVFMALWGAIDGEAVFGVFGVDGATNLAHLVLGALGIGAAAVSPTTKGQQRARRGRRRAPERTVEPTEGPPRGQVADLAPSQRADEPSPPTR